jgi:hypothetical protein
LFSLAMMTVDGRNAADRLAEHQCRQCVDMIRRIGAAFSRPLERRPGIAVHVIEPIGSREST